MYFTSQHKVSSQDCSTTELPTQLLVVVGGNNKKVSFAATARVKRAIHINDYTDDEIQATWYNHDEMRAIHDEINVTVQFVFSGKTLNKKDFSFRGLEFATAELLQPRSHNKAVARHAVLQEQKAQFYSGSYSEERLAQVYQACNFHCQLAANLFGAKDAKAAACTKKKLHRAHSSHRTSSIQPTISSRQPRGMSCPMKKIARPCIRKLDSI
jgi:hypothetical protein